MQLVLVFNCICASKTRQFRKPIPCVDVYTLLLLVYIPEWVILTIHTGNKKKALVVKLLQSSGYPSDPVKKWKNSVSDDVEEEEGEEGEGEREGGGSMEDGADYNYLLSMSLWSLTLEKKEEIMKKRDEKVGHVLHP